MNDFKTNLSSNLQKLIHKKKLSISELARRVHIPQPTIYRIVHGKHQNPHKKTLRILSDFFNVTMDQLLGLELIQSVVTDVSPILRVPILNSNQIVGWPHIKSEHVDFVIYEKPISQDAFALRMPDKSMEPLIAQHSLLIIDIEKKPVYRSLVVIKLHNCDEVVVRQLIKDATSCYIRPLNQDFDQFEMVMLTAKDFIIGTVVEARLDCEGL